MVAVSEWRGSASPAPGAPSSLRPWTPKSPASVPSGVGGTGRREAGYSMVMLVILITVMTILLGMALPSWSKWIQREKEEELIFRGLQYAEAIRIFRSRFGRLPVRLEELIEVQPRSIRQLWKDPMTEDGKWGLLFEGAQAAPPGAPAPPADGRPAPQPPPAQAGGGNNPGQNLVAVPPGEGGITVGPIAGVYSRSSETSFKVLFGAQQYDQWRFSYQLLTGAGGLNAPGGGNVSAFGLKAEWIGRPFREGVAPPTAVPPGGAGPGGQGAGAVDAAGRPITTPKPQQPAAGRRPRPE